LIELNKEKMNISILGFGNLGSSIAGGLKSFSNLNKLYITKKDIKNLNYNIDDEKCILTNDNLKAVLKSDIIFLTVQPKQFKVLAEEIKGHISSDQIIISPITGISIKDLENAFGNDKKIIRCMTNTAVAVKQAVTCICSNKSGKNSMEIVENIFNKLGHTIIIEEKNMQAATVISASGIAFWMRLIRATAQGGIQLGFESNQALEMSVMTSLGAAKLLEKNQSHPEDEIDKVTTPNGCTIEGLIEMEHQGLSSALIKGIEKSFNKINLMKKE
jgi:pyrroline-5-carboxylate reductase